MKSLLYFLLLFSLAIRVNGQYNGKQDTALQVFWNKDLVVEISFSPVDADQEGSNNTALTLRSLKGGSRTILFRDSVYSGALITKLKDMNGDGVPDLLLYCLNNGRENESFHLYLVDNKNGRLINVRKFERLFNPFYDSKNCWIWATESFEARMLLRTYLVNDQGILLLLSR